MTVPLKSIVPSTQSEERRVIEDPVESRVSVKELLAYAGPALPVQMILLVTVIYLPSFYALQRGLSMSAVGAMFFAARLWDTVTDTFIGGLSDSTVTRWGRRKPWVAGATPFLLVAAYFLFVPPAGGASSLYLGCWLFLFYLAWTAVQIPYLAWGAELSNNYIERSRVVAFREALGTIGVMLATALPLMLLTAKERELSGVLRVAFFGVLVMLPLTVLVAITVAGVERTRHVEVKFTWRVMVDAVRTNPLFVRFLAAQLLFATGWNIFLASIVIIVEYALNLRGQYLSLVLLMNLTATVCMPLAIRLGRRVDKHRALAIAMLGFVVFYIALSSMPPNHYWLTATAFLFLGLCWSPVLINMHAMIPDLVDVGEFRGQSSQAGIYMAIYYVVVKMGMALGVGVGLPLLEAVGFHIRDASAVSGQRAIMWVSLCLPAVLTLPAIVLYWNYPLTRKRHKALRIWLDGHPRSAAHP